jgi:DNA mismatch endonuclease (patch repair protein)
MQNIKSKDTSIELILRKELWNRGIRYRKNFKELIGKPDIVLTKYKVVIFCDSEFWHGYDWENRKNDFKSNQTFWIPKIERNMERDKKVTSSLEEQGWTVIRFWGKEIKKNTDGCVDKILETIEREKKNV